MPDPPSVSLLTRYVLENPWPLGLGWLAVAVGVAWVGLRAQRPRQMWVAAAVAVAAALVFAAASLVTTAGEHARGVVIGVVDAVVEADVAGAGAYLTDDAVLTYGSPGNPGLPRSVIEQRIGQLQGIASNTITRLAAHSESADRAVVELACRTTPQIGLGPIPTSWWIEVERQPDGTWKIDRITWVSILGRGPESGPGY
jgi:hypothetical protein